MKFFEIFKAGNYPQGAFTESDINALCSNYDPSFCEAPLTLDHTQKGPAYGWVDSLKNENGSLKASFRDVTEDLKEFVQSGKYRKVSVEIYRDLEGRKPYLKAVSFLGAAIPQVKGMEPIEFKESPSDVYTFEIEEEPAESKELQEIQDNIQKLNTSVSSFNEQLDKLNVPENKEIQEAKTQIVTLQEKVEDLSQKLSQYQESEKLRQKSEEELKTLKSQIRQKEFEQFLDEYLSKGTLTQAQKDQMIAVFTSLDTIPCFEEENQAISSLKELVKSLPKQVVFEELATKTNQALSEPDMSKFENASEESLTLYKEAKALSETENISFRDALLKINRSK
jgi:TolA-binding protein